MVCQSVYQLSQVQNQDHCERSTGSLWGGPCGEVPRSTPAAWGLTREPAWIWLPSISTRAGVAEPLPQPPTTLLYLRVPRFCWPFPMKAPRGWCDSGWVLLLVQRPCWILPGAGPHCKPGGDAQMGQMVAQLIRVKSPVISSFHGSPLALVRPAPGRDLWQTSCHRFIEGHVLALPH